VNAAKAFAPGPGLRASGLFLYAQQGKPLISFSIVNAKNIYIFCIKIQYAPAKTRCIGKRKWYQSPWPG